MRPPSSNWLKEIEVFRNRDSDDSYNIPIYPWLAPPLHPKIRSLIERWGVEKEEFQQTPPSSVTLMTVLTSLFLSSPV